MSLLHKFFKKLAWDYNKCTGLYLRVCKPRNDEYADFLKHKNFFYAQGEGCLINQDVTFTDPKYVRMGNNICLATCTLVGHDASSAILSKAYGVKLDAVGKIDIKDNVFIGHNAIILPDVTIGPNAIVAAGAVVTKDVAEGTVVGGVPAKKIGSVDSLVARLEEKTKNLPWAKIIAEREGGYDPRVEPELLKQRVKYFYED